MSLTNDARNELVTRLLERSQPDLEGHVSAELKPKAGGHLYQAREGASEVKVVIFITPADPHFKDVILRAARSAGHIFHGATDCDQIRGRAH